MIKASLAVLLLVAFAGQAAAISRYNAPALSCDDARAKIRTEGAVILRYPSKRVANMTLYDRYVRDSDACDSNEYAEWTDIPTRDNPKCPVLSCQPIEDLIDSSLIIPRHRL